MSRETVLCRVVYGCSNTEADRRSGSDDYERRSYKQSSKPAVARRRAKLRALSDALEAVEAGRSGLRTRAVAAEFEQVERMEVARPRRVTRPRMTKSWRQRLASSAKRAIQFIWGAQNYDPFE